MHELKSFEELNNMPRLTPHQAEAVDKILELFKKQQIITFQAPAGAGKTFTLKFLIPQLPYKKIATLAFTGAATRLLKQKDLPNCSTIHQFLYMPIIEGGMLVGFQRKDPEDIRKNINLIIIDEYSMVSKELMADLEALNIPMLLVGDNFQLPPVLASANKYVNQKDIELTEVVRQAENSKLLEIITELRLIGNKPEYGIYGDNEVGVFRKLDMQDDWIQSKDLNFVVGFNKTRNEFNLKHYGNIAPNVGDNIIFLKNNYKIGVFNGQEVIITSIKPAPIKGYYKINCVDPFDNIHYKKITIQWVLENAEFNPSKNIVQADFAFARTCHKLQGSTVDKILVYDESYLMKSKELQTRWLYTALSRASEKAILLY